MKLLRISREVRWLVIFHISIKTSTNLTNKLIITLCVFNVWKYVSMTHIYETNITKFSTTNIFNRKVDWSKLSLPSIWTFNILNNTLLHLPLWLSLDFIIRLMYIIISCYFESRKKFSRNIHIIISNNICNSNYISMTII